MNGAAVSAEEDVHERGDVGVIAGLADALVVPVVKFRRADEPAERTDGESGFDTAPWVPAAAVIELFSFAARPIRDFIQRC